MSDTYIENLGGTKHTGGNRNNCIEMLNVWTEFFLQIAEKNRRLFRKQLANVSTSCHSHPYWLECIEK